MRWFAPHQTTAWIATAVLTLCFLAGCASTAVAPAEALPETSVKPGINESFLDPNLSVEKYVVRFRKR